MKRAVFLFLLFFSIAKPLAYGQDQASETLKTEATTPKTKWVKWAFIGATLVVAAASFAIVQTNQGSKASSDD